MLRGRRAALHARAVQAFMDQSPVAAETQADLLGYHCSEAGLIEQAIDHWLKAGQLALTRFAHAEAITQLQKGVQALGQVMDDATRRRKEIDLLLALANALFMAYGNASTEGGDALRQAWQLCSQTDRSQRFIELSLLLFYFTTIVRNSQRPPRVPNRCCVTRRTRTIPSLEWSATGI
jgi:predicted ATPase